MNWGALGKASLRVNLVLAVAFSLRQLADFQTFFNAHDFNLYRNDALNAWTQGWQSYYGSGDGNVNPPLQGLIMFPILPFSPAVGFFLWTLLGLGCMFLIWRLAGSKRQWWQFPILVLFFPSVYGLAFGQVIFVVAAAITVAWWLSERGQGLAAGLVLSLATLKPQLILLLPLVLLLSGRKREFVGFVLGSLALGALSLGLVGVGGVEQMLANQHYELAHKVGYSMMDAIALSVWLPGWMNLGLIALATLFTLWTAHRIRGTQAAVVFVIGILGSLLVAPFMHPQDLVLWFVAALLMLRSVGLPRGLAASGVFLSWLPVFGVPLVTLGGMLVVLLGQHRCLWDSESPTGGNLAPASRANPRPVGFNNDVTRPLAHSDSR